MQPIDKIILVGLLTAFLSTLHPNHVNNDDR